MFLCDLLKYRCKAFEHIEFWMVMSQAGLLRSVGGILFKQDHSNMLGSTIPQNICTAQSMAFTIV